MALGLRLSERELDRLTSAEERVYNLGAGTSLAQISLHAPPIRYFFQEMGLVGGAGVTSTGGGEGKFGK